MDVRALLTESDGITKTTRLTTVPADDLGDGDVTVRVQWSTVNYKDGNAVLQEGRVMTRLPLIGGIDLAGVVEDSDDPRFAPGDRVLANGHALGMSRHGGYAALARVPGDWLLPVPDVFTTRQAMAIGTAGYTAMLCILALERHGIHPSAGDVLVTGAAGGVGSVAISLLSELGYTVTASTGRPEQTAYLRRLGAAAVIPRQELSGPAPRLAPERWAGAVDCVGSDTLANVLSQMRYDGVVSACGLAQGNDLPGWVTPFLARNITLVGIDSVLAPRARREEAWQRLAETVDIPKLESTITEIVLADVPRVAADILRGRVLGRTVVDVNA